MMSCLRKLGFRQNQDGQVETRLGQWQRSLSWIEERGFQEASYMSDLPIFHDLLRCCPQAKGPDGARCGHGSLLNEQGQE